MACVELTTVAMSRKTGVSYKALDAWERAGALVAIGAGQARRWRHEDVPRVRAVARLAELGAKRDVLVRVGRYLADLPVNLFDGPLFLRRDGMVLPTSEGAGYVIDLAECMDAVTPLAFAV